MNKLPETQIRLCIVNRRYATNGFQGEYHRHPFYEIGFVLEGECVWHLRRRPAVKLKAGQVVLIPPECAHRERSPEPVRLGWLGFENLGPIGPELLCRAITLGGDLENAHELLRRIGEEQTAGRSHATELIGLALRSLLLVVKRAAEGEPRVAAKVGGNPHQRRVAASVAAYLEQNIARPLSLAEVARYHNLTPQHLSLIFKRCYGTTPTAYRLRQRIEHARGLLKANPDHTLKTIAAACGFTDATHFGKEFRRWTGRTPRQAR